jgi:hypothetical protein
VEKTDRAEAKLPIDFSMSVQHNQGSVENSKSKKAKREDDKYTHQNRRYQLLQQLATSLLAYTAYSISYR